MKRKYKLFLEKGKKLGAFLDVGSKEEVGKSIQWIIIPKSFHES